MIRHRSRQEEREADSSQQLTIGRTLEKQFNPLTPRVKPWVRLLIPWIETLSVIVEQYFTVVLFNFTQFVILENLSILDLSLSGVKVLKYVRTKRVQKPIALSRRIGTMVETKSMIRERR